MVTFLCNNGSNSSTTYLIRNKNDITGLILVQLNQQCNISIVFSNEAGSSEPFMLAFGKYAFILHIRVFIYSMISLTDTHLPSPNITNVTDTTTTTTQQLFSTTIPVSTTLNVSTG